MAEEGAQESAAALVKARSKAPTAALTEDQIARKREIAEAKLTYGRGKAVPTRNIRDKKLRSNLRALEKKYRDAAVRAKDAEILQENDSGFLEPETELERTYKVRQDDIQESVGIETARKGFELRLDAFGPYKADYTRNGRHLLLAGRKGHVATMDWREGKLGCELHLNETVRDAKWLHNNQYFAVAQKKYVHIYDAAGVQLHVLQKHIEVTQMEFLPYHFLLATIVSTPVSRLQNLRANDQRRGTPDTSNIKTHPQARWSRSTRRNKAHPPPSRKTRTTPSSTSATRTAKSASGPRTPALRS